MAQRILTADNFGLLKLMAQAKLHEQRLDIYRRSFDPLRFTHITVWTLLTRISIREALMGLWALAMAAASITAAVLHVISKFH